MTFFWLEMKTWSNQSWGRSKENGRHQSLNECRRFQSDSWDLKYRRRRRKEKKFGFWHKGPMCRIFSIKKKRRWGGRRFLSFEMLQQSFLEEKKGFPVRTSEEPRRWLGNFYGFSREVARIWCMWWPGCALNWGSGGNRWSGEGLLEGHDRRRIEVWEKPWGGCGASGVHRCVVLTRRNGDSAQHGRDFRGLYRAFNTQKIPKDTFPTSRQLAPCQSQLAACRSHACSLATGVVCIKAAPVAWGMFSVSCNGSTIGDLSFQVKDPCRTFQDVCHFCCSALYLHIPKYRLRYHNFKYMLQILYHDPYITYPVL